ncbi:MAG: AsmA family protein [Gemmobacter sp.]|jgi:AsmA protein|nr:AsmA family protein [Gemmobacter sp.]
MRWLVRLVSSVLVLVLLLAVMTFLMPKDGIADLLEDRFAQATGRRLEIGPVIRPTIWPVLGVTAGPVRLSNPEGSAAPDTLTAPRIAIALDLRALLSGVLRITGVEIDQPELLLERQADGTVNWTIHPPRDEGAAEDSGPPVVTLDWLRIRNGRLTLLDAPTGLDLTLDQLEIDTAVPEFAGPVALTVRGLIRGQPVTLDAEIDALGPFLGGRLSGLAVEARAGAARLAFTGRASTTALDAKGRLEADLNDRPALEAVLGRPFPALPEGLGTESLTLAADLTLSSEGSVHLRAARILADGGQIAGEADWQKGKDRPRLTGRFAMDRLVLGQPADHAAEATPHNGWSESRIDAGALAALDADLLITVRAAQIGPLRLGTGRFRLAVDRARAVIGLDRTEAYGGIVAGKLVVNARDGLSASADLAFEGFEMEALLVDLLGSDRVLGQGRLEVSLLGAGDSMAALMRGLSGGLRLDLGRGELRGLDIAGMLRTMDPGYAGAGMKTAFEAAHLSARIEGGVVTSDELHIRAPLFTASGTGQVNLGRRRIDYRLLPRPAEAVDGSGEIAVLISGSWEKPKIRLDLEWLAEQRQKAEQARTEDLARQRLDALAPEAPPAESPEAAETGPP